MDVVREAQKSLLINSFVAISMTNKGWFIQQQKFNNKNGLLKPKRYLTWLVRPLCATLLP
jgi:hypothetical protein